jgi:hypothetical protein
MHARSDARVRAATWPDGSRPPCLAGDERANLVQAALPCLTTKKPSKREIATPFVQGGKTSCDRPSTGRRSQIGGMHTVEVLSASRKRTTLTVKVSMKVSHESRVMRRCVASKTAF